MKRTKTAFACILAASLALFTPAIALADDAGASVTSAATAMDAAAAAVENEGAETDADAIETLANGEASQFFFDTAAGDWYVQDCSLDYVVDNDLIKGYFEGEFAGNFRPGATITRAEVATILWRIAGEPTPDVSNTFKDVHAGDWYLDAVTWAADMKIINGYSENGALTGYFGPNDTVTRQDLATMMGRMADYAYGENVGQDYVSTDVTKMPDVDAVEEYAFPWLGWCYDNGIMTGENGWLKPTDTAERCEMAKMTRVFCTLLGVPEYPTTQAEREKALADLTVVALDEGFGSSTTGTVYEVYVAPAQNGLEHSLVIDFSFPMTASQFWAVAPSIFGELTASVANLGETIHTASVEGAVDIPVHIRLYDTYGELLLHFRNGELL